MKHFYTLAFFLICNISFASGIMTSSVPGCTDPVACNFDSLATVDNGTCDYISFSINSLENVSCFDDQNGEVSISVTGGSNSYFITWDNGQTGTSLTNLSAGSYDFTIQDQINQCSLDSFINISQPDELTITLTETDVTCFGDDNGEINANVQGGITTSPYNYIWSSDIGVNPPPSDFIDGLAPGTYTLNVFDANNCPASDQVQITEPAVLSSNFVNIDSTLCFGSNDGAAEVTGIDGTPNYSYSWDDGQTNALATGLSAGQYVCTITDFNGCSTNISVDVHQPTLLTSSEVNVSNVSCFGLMAVVLRLQVLMVLLAIHTRGIMDKQMR